ncbi:hypothetical protein HA44_00545 [Mixta gaviniae]|nr:hypothetical protein HA44_00545 [Mixta gaviniae]
MDNGAVNIQGASSSGIAASGAATLAVSNSRLSLTGLSGYGIDLADSAALTADGLDITLSAPSSSAMSIRGGDVKARISNSTITVSDSYSGLELRRGDLIADGLTITATGDTYGVRIGDGGAATAAFANSEINIERSRGMLIFNAAVTLDNVNIVSSGRNANALDINQAASVTASGGHYTTYGTLADAVWLASSDTHLDIHDAALATFGDAAHALNAQKGGAAAEGVTMSTLGVESYGFYTETDSSGRQLAIETHGDRARAPLAPAAAAWSYRTAPLIPGGSQPSALSSIHARGLPPATLLLPRTAMRRRRSIQTSATRRSAIAP